MAGFFATKGNQPPPLMDRGTGLLTAAIDSQAMHDHVAAFKKLFEPQPAILADGQFLYSQQIESDFRFAMNQMLSAKLIVGGPAQNFRALWETALASEASRYAADHAADIAKVPATAAAFALSAKARAEMEAIAGKDGVDLLFPSADQIKIAIGAIATFMVSFVDKQLVAANLDVTGIPLKGGSNVYHYIIAYALSAEKCFKTCGRIARIHRLETNVKAANFGRLGRMAPSGKKENEAFATIMRRKFVTPRVVNYNQTASTATMLNALIATLNAKLIVRAGVMSGEAYEKPFALYPDPEHYILLLAALPLPQFRAVAFLFWDPDVESTKLTGAGNSIRFPHSYGFMFAYYEADQQSGVDRLLFSTGYAPGDLVYSQPASGDHDMNFHVNDQTRHRYQIVSLFNP